MDDTAVRTAVGLRVGTSVHIVNPRSSSLPDTASVVGTVRVDSLDIVH